MQPPRAVLLCLVCLAAAHVPAPVTGARNSVGFSTMYVEYLAGVNAVGIDSPQPRFSWQLGDTSSMPRGAEVAAFRVQVREYPDGPQVWDSGDTVFTPANGYNVVYNGSALAAATPYTWTLNLTFINDARPSAIGTARFDTGLFLPSDWLGAEFLGGRSQNQLRSEFELPGGSDDAVVFARAYVASPGGHVMYVHGQPVDCESGYGAWVQNEVSNVYWTHNLTGLLTAGKANAVGLLAGHSMYPHSGLKLRIEVILSSGRRISLISTGTPSPPPPPPSPAQNVGQCGSVREHTRVEISCAGAGAGANAAITKVSFASYGMPVGACTGGSANTFARNASCDMADSAAKIAAVCVGHPNCTFTADEQFFGGDPCRMVAKHLDVAVECGAAPGPKPGPPRSLVAPPFRATASYIVSDDPWVGAVSDWRLYQEGWAAVGFDDSAWVAAAVTAIAASTTRFRSLMAPPVRVSKTITVPGPTGTTAEGDAVYDLGQNIVGFCRLAVPPNSPAGSSLNLTHGEVYNSTGLFGTFKGQRDIHILRAGQTGTLQPHFVWHGFQYVVVRNNGTTFKGGPLSCMFMHTDLERTGSVRFLDDAQSNGTGALLNQIQGLILNSQRANVAAWIPTDCPTREKHGWLGDAQVTAEEALFNFQMAPVYQNYLQIIADAQNPTSHDVPGVVPTAPSLTKGRKVTDISWSAAYALIPAWMLHYNNDVRIANTHYPGVQSFVDMLHEQAVDQQRPMQLPDFFTWGDWCAVGPRSKVTPATGPELAAFNYLLSVDAMVSLSNATGRSDAAKYEQLGAMGRAAFYKLYHNATTGTFGPAVLDVQSLTAAPLALGNVIPPSELAAVTAALLDNIKGQDFHLTFGSVGAKHLLHQLSNHGLHEAAVRIATQRSYPSFGHWLALGATTCWENWHGFADPSHPPEPTHNHIFLCGGIGEWMYKDLAGIGITAPGGSALRIAPRVLQSLGPGGVEASKVTPRGLVTVAWSRKATTGLTLRLALPPGAPSEVLIPLVAGASAAKATITESSHPVWSGGAFHPTDGITAGRADPANDAIALTVASGIYSFDVLWGN